MLGTTLKTILCPYCNEPQEIVVDTSVLDQQYIEDCQVCCQPITFKVSVPHDLANQQDEIHVEALHQDEY